MKKQAPLKGYHENKTCNKQHEKVLNQTQKQNTLDKFSNFLNV